MFDLLKRCDVGSLVPKDALDAAEIRPAVPTDA
jgi:hypothetical protein